ncbi:HNH/endonuclease VII fold putative polymorphic toxin [Pseudomonas sp. 34 E 7]|uniref:HNH/endonuclease VII fold putative polymorphic toxin n=1 Tax=Pseudomonas sp. 34 E 7 TaxID=1844102 RepID=UPI0035322C3C
MRNSKAGKNGVRPLFFWRSTKRGLTPIFPSQQPSRVLSNVDRRGNPQPGKIYEFEVPAPGGGIKTVRIRDDAGGHDFGSGNSQNRGPHFNDASGKHYDY